MSLNVTATALPGVLIIEPRVFADSRGFFLESWRSQEYAQHGIPPFVQDNVSRSQRDTLRGLHCQEPFGQGKLVHVLEGAVLDVAVDIRTGSPTFGQWVAETLSADNHRQIYIPPGFAHGFYVLSDTALFAYKCTEYYHPESEFSIAWNDPELAITWPTHEPTLSARDKSAPPLSAVLPDRLPRWEA